MTGDHLEPLAVILLDLVTDNQMQSLKQYAESSNSNLVYAHDELGNDIAVGVFVTEQFTVTMMQSQKIEDEYSSHELKEHPNITSLGAVEECPSEICDDMSVKADYDERKEHQIRVYKVNKKKKGKTQNHGKAARPQKTLQQLKRSKVLPSESKLSCTRRMEQKRLGFQCKKVLTKRKHKFQWSTDKSYRPSFSLKIIDLPSELLIVLYINLQTIFKTMSSSHDQHWSEFQRTTYFH